MATLWERLNESAADVVERVHKSVVLIRTGENSVGAGTIWHSDGLIITSAHVVVGKHVRDKLDIVLHNGETFSAQVIAHDSERDIAALNINATNLPTIQPGKSSDVLPGQWLMALGHPWGVPDVLVAGVVIGTGNQLPEADGRDWIAVDMKMRPGHSGGPLFDDTGRLVGINTMIRGPEVSFAVPVDAVTAFLKEALSAAVTQTPIPDETHLAPDGMLV